MELTLAPMSPTLCALLRRPDNAQHTRHVIVHLRPCELRSDDIRKATNIIRQMRNVRTLELHYRVGSPVLDFMHQIVPSSFPQLQSFRLQPEPPEGPSDWKQTDISAVLVFQLSDLPRVDEQYLHWSSTWQRLYFIRARQTVSYSAAYVKNVPDQCTRTLLAAAPQPDTHFAGMRGPDRRRKSSRMVRSIHHQSKISIVSRHLDASVLFIRLGYIHGNRHWERRTLGHSLIPNVFEIIFSAAKP
ncbi:hypothetical protein CC80DRAFT_327719 [Byssothecium circinans]|uniref:Uncharacterized protein n=1 Tax=Byssothecium circinans TaxID=147558 RepID=A0A6A5U681_9PLEO|nr:hypothetical protein CC80DRAFT_327719 [Byssothecium circinans]